VNLPIIASNEYKWVKKDGGIPALQINTTGNGTVTQIQYKDSIPAIGIEDIYSVILEASIFPNPSNENVSVKYSLNKKADVIIELFSADGKQIFSEVFENQVPGEIVNTFNLTSYHLSDGNYLVRLSTGNEKHIMLLQVK
jgi:hypothetical protein